MLNAAAKRKKTAESWISYLHGSEHTEILDVVEIKNPSAPKNMAAPKLFGAIIDAAAMLALILLRIISDAHGIFGFLFTASIIIVSTVLLARFFKNIKIWKNLKDTKRNVTALIECVKSVLFDIGALEDKKISTDISEIQSGEEIKIHCAVHAASVHDKRIFSEAAAEAVSAIDSPRYVAVKTGFFGAKYYLSYACPSVAGNKKENAERFSEKLKSYMGKFTSVYTRNENGLKVLSECRKNSYLNAAKCEVKIKKIAKATQRDQRRAP